MFHYLFQHVLFTELVRFCFVNLEPVRRCLKVNFNLQKKSVEVNLVYFLSLMSLESFWTLLFKFDN